MVSSVDQFELETLDLPVGKLLTPSESLLTLLACVGLHTTKFMRPLKVRMRVSGAPGFPVLFKLSWPHYGGSEGQISTEIFTFAKSWFGKYCMSKCSWFETMTWVFLNLRANIFHENQQIEISLALVSIFS